MTSMPGTHFNTLATKPALSLGSRVPTTAAAPLELLKQVNELRAKVAAQEQTIAGLKQAVTGMFESIDKLTTGQVALKNQFINFKTGEHAEAMEKIAGMTANLAALEEKSNFHTHIQKMAVNNGDGQKILQIATTSPSFNCKRNQDGKTYSCTR